VNSSFSSVKECVANVHVLRDGKSPHFMDSSLATFAIPNADANLREA